MHVLIAFKNNIVSGIHPTFDWWEDIMKGSQINEKWIRSNFMLISACEIADLIIATLTVCVACQCMHSLSAGFVASLQFRHNDTWPLFHSMNTSVSKNAHQVVLRMEEGNCLGAVTDSKTHFIPIQEKPVHLFCEVWKRFLWKIRTLTYRWMIFFWILWVNFTSSFH